MHPRLILLIVSAGAIYGSGLNVSTDGVTAQQAILSFNVSDPSRCAFQVFADAYRTHAVDDTNEGLFQGSTACNRAGSVVEGSRVSFVAGLRTAQLAADGLMHSRSLATKTTYYYSMTDQVSGITQSGQFTTADLPAGSTYPEQVPYDANGFGNAAYPTLDFGGTGQGCGNSAAGTTPCIDPVSGLQYWLFTSPGANGTVATIADGGQTMFETPAITGGSCDSPASMVSSPGVGYATCTGALVASLRARSDWTVPGSGHPVYPFGVSYAGASYAPRWNIDDLIAFISGSASDGANGDNVINVCLWDGSASTCLGRTFTITLPVGGAPQQFTVPHGSARPYWQDWGYEPDQGYAAQPSIRIWRAGSGGSVKIAAWFAGAASSTWWNSAAAPIRCEDTPRQVGFDRNGNAISPSLSGYMCYAAPLGGPPQIWLWIPLNADGSARAEARWLGAVDAALNVDVAGIYGGSIYGGYPASAPTEIARMTYNPAKYAWCGYQDLRTVGSYGSTIPAPCFDVTILTSNGFTAMMAAWGAQHPDISDTSNWTGGAKSVTFRGGVAILEVTPNPAGVQAPAISSYFDSTGRLLGVNDTFTNHYCQGGAGATCAGGTWMSKAGWGASEAPMLPSPDGQYATAVVGEAAGRGDGTAALSGPWTIPVLAVNRAGYNAPAAWDCNGCSGGVTQSSMITAQDVYQCPNTPLVQSVCPNSPAVIHGCSNDPFGVQSLCTPPALSVQVAPGAAYIDPNFGGTVNVVAPGAHQYSGISPLSKRGDHLHAIELPGGGAQILNASTGAVINTGAAVPYPVCYWSNSDDDVCYYQSHDVPAIMRYHVSSNSSETWIDYSGTFTGPLNDGDTIDITPDEWTAFWSDDQHTLCAVDLIAKQTYCADYLASNALNKLPITAIDYAAVTGVDAVSGKRYVLLLANPSMAIYSVDVAHKSLVLEARPESGPGLMGDNGNNNGNGVCEAGEACPSTPHGGTVQGPDGQQYFITAAGYQGTFSGQDMCELDLVAMRIGSGALSFTDAALGGGMTRILRLFACGTTWESYHVGCARTAATCVISTDGPAAQDGNTGYFNELFTISFGPQMAPTVTPVAMHRSSENQYWAQPRAAFDFGGEKIVFDSDFGGSTEYINYATAPLAGQCCVQVKVDQEPCNTRPFAGNTFGGNALSEAQALPCTTTDNRTVVNANWSKLQNAEPGDWLAEDNTGANGDWESFILAQKTTDAGGNVSGLWLLRESAVNGSLWSPLGAHQLAAVRHPCVDLGAGCPETNAGWSLRMRANWEQGSGSMWQFPVSGGAPLADNPLWANCAHEDGPRLRVGCGSSYQQGIDYGGQPFSATFFEDVKAGAPEWPQFAGSNAAPMQNVASYAAVAQNSAAVQQAGDAALMWGRVNAGPAAAPLEESTFCTYTATRISGDIYRLSSGGAADCYGKAVDLKRSPLAGRANPVLLKEVSGPGSAASFASTQNSVCYSLNAGECVAGSAAGGWYVNVAGAVYDEGCTDSYTLPASEGGAPRPCFYAAGAMAGRLREDDASRFSADAAFSRALSFVHGIPGGAAQQSYPSWDATGRFALVSGGFLEGKRADILAVLVPPMPPSDSATRSTYRPVPLTFSGSPGDRVRVCWGYAENAAGHDPAQGLYPMPRQEGGCSDASGAQPFLWNSEAPIDAACDQGCTVSLNLISGRVAYYYVRRTNGSRSSQSPLRVMAVN
ncbi:MAG TPA: hypothetical protein VFA04_01285 [Bryobacteraceae bacterium]|nr:hypothetical protein [Bryobacteraceae bacterium]